MTISLALLLAGHVVVFSRISALAKATFEEKSEESSTTTDRGRSTRCKSGDCFNGEGVYEFPNGDKYEGEFRGNQPHGWGVATSADGLWHEGDFVNAARTGRARVKYPDGGGYEGAFKSDRMHGSGTLVSPDGHRFTGEFLNGKHHGLGVYSYPGGGVYEGEYEGGVRHGLGVYNFPDGLRYKGEYASGKRHGQGALVTSDGHRYAGDFRSGVKAAFGVYSFKDGVRYQGEFFGDHFEGCGVLVLPRQSTDKERGPKRTEGRFEAGNFTGESCEGCCRSQVKHAREAAKSANRKAQSAVSAAAGAREVMRRFSGEL